MTPSTTGTEPHNSRAPRPLPDLTVLPAVPASAGVARRLVVEELERLGYPADHELCQTAELLTSELCTNAVVHAHVPGRGIGVRLRRGTDALQIEVSDAQHTTRLPDAPNPPAPHSRSGRGLPLIDALSARWGVHRTALGKTVWCELPLPAGQSAKPKILTLPDPSSTRRRSSR